MATSVSRYKIDSIMGEEAAEAFIVRFGGQLWSCPKRPSETLVDCVGVAAALAFCKHFGGENLSLPVMSKPSLKEKIIPLLEQGLSQNEIAKMLKCHWRTVAYVKQVLSRDGRKKGRAVKDRFSGMLRLPM